MDMVRGIKKYTAFILIIVLMTLTACAGGDRDIATPADNQDKHDETEVTAPEDKKVEENENDESEEVSLEEEEEMQPPVDLKGLKVNELGKIMVLMYHGIGEEEDVWVRTPENFRKDLQTLYDKGYRAIGMKDYIEGNIDTPPGTTPVIITFDDGLQGQFNVLGDGDEFVVDPNCAVGILEDFNKEYPDFGLKATFYVFYPTPFRQEKWVNKKFEYLAEKGMEIGNHAYNHENLRMDMSTKEPRDAEFIQEALGKNVMITRGILPGYEVDSLALPYGATPKDEDVYQYVIKGSFEGIEYHNKAILLVGANPAKPSFHKDTNMAKIPRIRASEMDTEGVGLYDWLDYFDRHPEERYISDGDPNTISFPKEMEEHLDTDRIGDKAIQSYE
jgi:peptidoglycan/xylan/chitin deacetylase (PgdA/CDA1 family)